MTRASVRILLCAAVAAGLSACAGSREAPLTADLPLHLEDHLDRATVTGSELPADPPAVVEWRFDEPQPDWKPVASAPSIAAPRLERTPDALRVTLGERTRMPDGRLRGGIFIEVPDWHQDAWSDVIVRARTASDAVRVAIVRNDRELITGQVQPLPWPAIGTTSFVTDGAVYTYRIPLHTRNIRSRATIPWQRLGVFLSAGEPGGVDILSVSVVPIAAMFVSDRLGMRSIPVGGLHRRSLFTHAPARVAYRLRVPAGGRIDTALGVLGAGHPVEFRVVAEPESGEAATLLRETWGDEEHWADRSVDLSGFAGQIIILALETDAAAPGTVALWGAPTVSGVRRTGQPNVIFYIIDGGGADYMSVYGYNRRTTPHLERIAAEGAVFEHAWSNADWTRPSTVSFLTSLQHSVLGGLRQEGNPVPDNVLTLAEHLHRAGYQTAELTLNPNAGHLSNLERGHDLFRDGIFGPLNPVRFVTSSVTLHEEYWQWRAAYPGEPYYVHFQTTDVHADHYAVPPFAGLFLSADRRRQLDTWNQRIRAEAGASPEGGIFGVIRRMSPAARERTGIDWVDYWTAQRDLHDETMAHQDYQLGRLVARLKAHGEWERTLFIVAADHGVSAGARDYEMAMRGPRSEDEDRPMFAPGAGRIPLIVVWPRRIAPGQRFGDAVSMIDMLPTILDLADLPLPEVMQGQSLGPLLLGEPGWEPRPVILDNFDADGTGRFWGRIEVVDGRWGASLQIPTPPGVGRYSFGPRSGPALRLYDLWSDPLCLNSLHETRPDLVEKYTKFLEDQFEVHQTLAKQFRPGAAPALTPDQLERLRALGYIR